MSLLEPHVLCWRCGRWFAQEGVAELASTRVLYGDFKYLFVCAGCTGSGVGHTRFERTERTSVDVAFVALFNMHMAGGHAPVGSSGDRLADTDAFSFADIDDFVRRHWAFLATPGAPIDDGLSAALFNALVSRVDVFRQLPLQPGVAAAAAAAVAEQRASSGSSGPLPPDHVTAARLTPFQLARFAPASAASVELLASVYPHVTAVDADGLLGDAVVAQHGSNEPVASVPLGAVLPTDLDWAVRRSNTALHALRFVGGTAPPDVPAANSAAALPPGPVLAPSPPGLGSLVPLQPLVMASSSSSPKRRRAPRGDSYDDDDDDDGEPFVKLANHPVGSERDGVRVTEQGYACMSCGVLSRWRSNAKRHVKTTECGVDVGVITAAQLAASRDAIRTYARRRKEQSAELPSDPPASPPPPPRPPPPPAREHAPAPPQPTATSALQSLARSLFPSKAFAAAATAPEPSLPHPPQHAPGTDPGPLRGHPSADVTNMDVVSAPRAPKLPLDARDDVAVPAPAAPSGAGPTLVPTRPLL